MAEDNLISVDRDGMDDLGNLPRQTIAIKNRHNGQITLQSEYLYEGGPGLEGWEQVVRYAVSHQKDYDLLETLNGEKSPLISKKHFTLNGGADINLTTLKALHPKTRLALAKRLEIENIDIKGKTPRQLDELIMERVNSLEADAVAAEA